MAGDVGLAMAVGGAAVTGGTRKPITEIFTSGAKRRRGGGGGGGGGLSGTTGRKSEAEASIAEGNKTLKDYQVAAAARDEEIAVALQGGRVKEATGQQDRKANELLMAQYGDVYNAYRTLGGKAAAQLMNQIRANEIEDAADVIQYEDKQGQPRLRFVDRAGRTVQSKQGPADLSLTAMEAIAAPKGKFKASGGKDGFTFNEATGKIGERAGGGSGLRGAGVDTKQLQDAESFFRKAAEKSFGFNVDPSASIKMKADRQAEIATAMYRQAINAGNRAPDRNAIITTANRAIRQIENDARQIADQEYDERSSALQTDVSQFGMSESKWKQMRAQQISDRMLGQMTGRVPAGEDGAGLGRGQPGQVQAQEVGGAQGQEVGRGPGQAPEVDAQGEVAPTSTAPQPPSAPNLQSLELRELQSLARKEPEAYAELARRMGVGDEEIDKAMEFFFRGEDAAAGPSGP